MNASCIFISRMSKEVGGGRESVDGDDTAPVSVTGIPRSKLLQRGSDVLSRLSELERSIKVSSGAENDQT